MKALDRQAVACVPGAELVVARAADQLWGYWKSWNGLAAALKTTTKKPSAMNNECTLPYYRAHGGSAVGVFNPSMEKLQWGLNRGEYDTSGYSLILERDFIQVTEPLLPPLPASPFPLPLQALLFISAELSIHYLVQCIQKCPHLMSSKSGRGNRPIFSKFMKLLIYTFLSYVKDLKRLSSPRFIFFCH